MAAWTDNPTWDTAPERIYCGRVVGGFIPCKHRYPCPIHDASPPAGGVPLAGSTPPAPPLFEEDEAA